MEKLSFHLIIFDDSILSFIFIEIIYDKKSELNIVRLNNNIYQPMY